MLLFKFHRETQSAQLAHRCWLLLASAEELRHELTHASHPKESFAEFVAVWKLSSRSKVAESLCLTLQECEIACEYFRAHQSFRSAYLVPFAWEFLVDEGRCGRPVAPTIRLCRISFASFKIFSRPAGRFLPARLM